jgi:HK97 family phage portal protein
LDNGLEFQGLSFSPEDAELLESRKFSVVEIARLYSVPPPLAGDFSHSSFTNSETASRWFAQFTLAPWIRKIEACFKQSVFGQAEPDLSLEIDMAGLTRGDYQARWAAHKIALETGALTRDEVRDLEGYQPLGGQTV